MKRVVMTGLSDTGRMRGGNEDCIATHPEFGLAVLADGMGGHQAGEVASNMAVDIVMRHFEEREWKPAGGKVVASEAQAVAQAIQKANTAVYDAAQNRLEYRGMGSTVVVAVFYGDHMCVGHVGDSRLYRLREGSLEQLTRDHSVVQELVTRGLFTAEEARQSVAKNLVTRALGVDANIEPDISEAAVVEGEIYLLCSDGLNDVVNDPEIVEVLTKHGENLKMAAKQLIDLANERGGPDNISVILVAVKAA